jgi:glycosyltransferase involved in cell wall biosynthesis
MPHFSIGFVYEEDAADITVQSGRPYHIRRALAAAGHTVVDIFPLAHRPAPITSAKVLLDRLQGRNSRHDRDPQALADYSRQVERALAHRPVDFLFSAGSRALASVRTTAPILFCADATFRSMIGFYGSFSDLSPWYVEQGDRQERLALSNCAAALYPSQWAADSAISDYGTLPGKVHVVAFGSNLSPPPRAEVERAARARPRDLLRILFIGRDWMRKGGPLVVEVANRLVATGTAVQLDVVGPTERPAGLPDWANYHGVVEKSGAGGESRLGELYSQAHFFFVPSRAEAYGLVFCEAAGFGVPSVSLAVGGIPAVVRDGVTGICFAQDTPPDAIGQRMLEIFQSEADYNRLSSSTLDVYERELNWDKFAERLTEIAAGEIERRRNG